MSSDAAVGEEIRRVGEDEVDGGFGDLREDFQTVAVVEANVVFEVVEGDAMSKKVGSDFCHGRLQVEPAPG